MNRNCGILAIAACATLVLGMGTARAQDVLIRNAKVYTQSDRGTLDRADVLVRNGRIAEVGSGLVARAGATVVDAQGRPLTPGLFGGITGLGIEEVELEPSTVDRSTVYGGDGKGEFEPRPEFDVTLAFNPDSVAIGVNRIEGITFAMVAPTAVAAGTMFAGQGAIARLDDRVDGFAPPSRTLFLDLGASATASAGKSRAAQFMLLEQATREADPTLPLRDGDLRLLTPTGREVLARYLGGGRVAFSVERAADIRQVLAWSARHGVRPVIVGGAQAWQVASLLAKSRVPVVLDPLVDLPGSFDQLGATMENAARLHRAGVPIAFTHFTAPTHNAHKVRQAAGVAVAHGLPWDAALAALTRAPAEIFGVGAELGRIAPGYAADLVLWSGDPLEVTSVAEQVWIAGQAQPMRSRQTELRDRYRPR
jgi:cytosine/adenosine deaminase-related metal-dependent hydrolase